MEQLVEPEWLDNEKTRHWHFAHMRTKGGPEWIIQQAFPDIKVGRRLGNGGYGTVYINAEDETLCHKFTYIDMHQLRPYAAWLDRLIEEQPVWYCGVRNWASWVDPNSGNILLRIDLNVIHGEFVTWEARQLAEKHGVRYYDIQGIMMADGTIKLIDGDPGMKW